MQKVGTLLSTIIMDEQVFREFMNEHVIPSRTKMDDFLPVILDLRKVAQIIMPAELPDSGILGATIDDRFRQKMAGKRIPGESLGDFIKSKTGKFWRRNRMQDIRFRLQALRDIYADVVEQSQSYRVYVDWIDKLGLKRKELESRPTIREMYIFKDDAVAVELEELQDLRKDIRYDAVRNPDPAIQGSFRVFPEEFNDAYLKKAGSILGFPVCCIDRYVFDRNSGVLSPEVRASNQIKHSESSDEIDKFAYFTKDFFPCQPDCPEAAELGKAMYDKLQDIDPETAEQYARHLVGNTALVKQYPEIIQKRMSKLKQQAGTEEVDQNEE